MKKLRHAIEYLTGEMLNKGRTPSIDKDQIQANLILMACNRQIYFECPVSPTDSERVLAMQSLLLARTPPHTEEVEIL